MSLMHLCPLCAGTITEEGHDCTYESKQNECKCPCHKLQTHNCMICNCRKPTPPQETWEEEVRNAFMDALANKNYECNPAGSIYLDKVFDIIKSQITLAVKKEREDILQKAKENKHTKAYIVGSKRVEKDYLFMNELVAIVNKEKK